MPGPRIPASEQPAVWARFLAELWRWVAEHGDARVPTSTVTTVDGKRYMLGSRVKNARVYYFRGSLTAEQVAQLEALPGWAWQGYAGFSRASWRARITELRAYAAAHGSVTGLDQANPSLGEWLRRMRRVELTDTQRAELAAIPRALETPTLFLDDFLAAIAAWLAENPERDAGDLTAATTVVSNGRPVRVGERAAKWRQRHRDGALDPQEVARLAAIPGWNWERRYRPGRPRTVTAAPPPD